MAIDCRKYIENFEQIRDKRGEVRPFNEWNDGQEKLYAAIKRCHAEGRLPRIIVLKARQIGFSTLAAGIIFEQVATKPNRTGGVMAHRDDSTKSLMEKYKLFHRSLPKGLAPSVIKDNDHEFWFNTKRKDGLNSGIKTYTAGGESIGRGDTFNYWHISEYAFWGNNKAAILLGILQTVPKQQDTLVIIESTANGFDDFRTRWYQAVNGQSDYIPVFVGWNEMKEYRTPFKADEPLTDEEKKLKEEYGLDDDQIQWRRDTIRNECGGDIRMFHQEYPVCVSGDTRVGTDKGLIKIKDIVEGCEATYGKVKKVIHNPVRDLYEVVTANGYTVKATENHPFNIVDKGFVELKDIKIGEKVKLSSPKLADKYTSVEWRDLGVDKKIVINEDWGRFLGLFMGDGSYSGETLSIVCDARDTDVIDEIKGLIFRLFGLTAHTRTVGSKDGGVEIRVHCKGLTEVFDRLNIINRRASDGGIIRNVCVPEVIFKSPKSVVKEFLKGIFDTDGFSDYKMPRIVLFSKYKEFLKDIQLLLLSFGIVSSLVSANKTNGTGCTYVGNELRLNGYRATRFMDEIGFIGSRKNAKMPSIKCPAKATKNDLEDQIVSITPCGKEPTFNLTIEEVHEFDANGIHTHNCPEEAFITSGNCYFETETVIKRLKEIEGVANPEIGEFVFDINADESVNDKTIRWRKNPNGIIKMYAPAVGGRPYVIGGDTAGHGIDNSVGMVLDNTNGNQVAVLCASTDEDTYAYQMYCLGKYYNDALMCIEVNFSPYENKIMAERLNYPNMFMRQVEDSITHRYEARYGFRTDITTRRLILAGLADVMRDNPQTIADVDTLMEMLTFIINTNGRAEAMQGEHDDRVMALAIAHYARGQQTTQVAMAKPVKKQKLNRMKGFRRIG